MQNGWVGIVVAVSSIMVGIVVAVTGWQIGNSVTNEVASIRAFVNRDLNDIKKELGIMRSSMDGLSRAVIINTERVRDLDDHEGRIRDLERTDRGLPH